MSLISINPSTGEILKKIEEWNYKKIDNQLNKNYKAFKKWRNTNIDYREIIINKIAKILRKNKSNYAKIITLEMGKPITQSLFEIDKCAKLCDYYEKNTKLFIKNKKIKTDANSSYINYSPLGIILGIMPWNYPFWQVFRWMIPSLMAGNICILKHSSNVPQCGNLINDIFKKINTEENIFCNIPLASNKIQYLINDNRISAISLTGSSIAGSKTAELSGKNLKKVVLELGGSDPFIVLPDANLEKTADMAVKSRMQNNGQSCIAAKRFIIHKDIFNEFEDIFIKKIKNLVVGDPMNIKTDIGPLARADLLREIDRQVKISVKKGAKIVMGGTKLKSNGFYYLPTIIKDITNNMPIYNEETFGPVAPLIKYKNYNEAIKIANDTIYGLGASIWTKNIENSKIFLNNIESGNLFINDIVKSDPRLPFGGIKKSGYGRELSNYGIKEFLNIQTVYIKK